jgi:hypothetical protein
MDDKIKYLLLAVGAYFLYDWYTGQAAAVAPIVPAGGAGTGTTPTTGTYGDTPITTPPITATPPIPVTPLPPWTAPVYTPPAQTPALQSTLAAMSGDEIATAAAAFNQDAIAESVRRGQRYDFHQWNWLRERTAGAQPDPSTYYGGNASDPVTAAEFYLVRATALATGIVQGMTGLGRHGGPLLPWSTAWQA